MNGSSAISPVSGGGAVGASFLLETHPLKQPSLTPVLCCLSESEGAPSPSPGRWGRDQPSVYPLILIRFITQHSL